MKKLILDKMSKMVFRVCVKGPFNQSFKNGYAQAIESVKDAVNKNEFGDFEELERLAEIGAATIKALQHGFILDVDQNDNIHIDDVSLVDWYRKEVSNE